MDLFARKSVGWTLSYSPDTKLAAKVLLMAFESRGRPKGVMFHSDQGAPTRVGTTVSYCGDIRLSKA